ncbi:MAG: pyridoxamine 5'-phosphate oxidase family protein [Actinomycetota bacterium]|nr:pyridoxamine 5'-phosphate oxidase family protein [Actinomycetota bacterium]
MSVPVDLSGLRDEVDRYGLEPYLITVSDDGRPHAVAVAVVWDGELMSTGAGSRTASNVADRPAVSLLWPPVDDGGYSLIVDGRAHSDPNGGRILVEPVKAVLHRRRAGGQGSDCVTVLASPNAAPAS